MTEEEKREVLFGIVAIYYTKDGKPEVHFRGRPDGRKVNDAMRHILMAYKEWQIREYNREEAQRKQEQEQKEDNSNG